MVLVSEYFSTIFTFFSTGVLIELSRFPFFSVTFNDLNRRTVHRQTYFYQPSLSSRGCSRITEVPEYDVISLTTYEVTSF